MGQEEIPADPATDERGVSAVYKDFSELSHRNTNHLVKKCDRTQKSSKRHEGRAAPAASGGGRLTPEEGVNRTSGEGSRGNAGNCWVLQPLKQGQEKGRHPGPRAQHPEMPSPGPAQTPYLPLPGHTQQLAPDMRAPTCAHHLGLGDGVPQGSPPGGPSLHGTVTACHPSIWRSPSALGQAAAPQSGPGCLGRGGKGPGRAGSHSQGPEAHRPAPRCSTVRSGRTPSVVTGSRREPQATQLRAGLHRHHPLPQCPGLLGGSTDPHPRVGDASGAGAAPRPGPGPTACPIPGVLLGPPSCPGKPRGSSPSSRSPSPRSPRHPQRPHLCPPSRHEPLHQVGRSQASPLPPHPDTQSEKRPFWGRTF